MTAFVLLNLIWGFVHVPFESGVWSFELGASRFESNSSWSQFRGPNGSGISDSAKNLPVDFSVASNLRWKKSVPRGHSSPIVVGDAIVITAFEPKQLSTICLDRATGDVRWRQDIEVSEFETYHPQHGPASATPTTDGKRVFSLFGSFGIVAYKLDGTELWRIERPRQANTFGSASSPVLADGRLILFIGNDEEGLVAALEPETGKIIWERRRKGPTSSWSTPAVWRSADQATLVVYEPFTLRVFNLVNGNDLWTVPGLADEPITIPQIAGGLIFTSSYNLRTNTEAIGLPAFADLLAECDANADGKIDADEAKRNHSVLSRPDADGQGDHPLRMFFRMLDENRDGAISETEWPRIKAWMEPWNHANGIIALRPSAGETPPALVWTHAVGVPECPTPIVVGERLYAIRNGGVVTCLNAANGEPHFQERIPAGGPYYASPVYGDGKLYFASARGQLTVLSAEPTLHILGSHDLGEPIFATPALVDNQIVIRSEDHLWLFERTTPEK